ncbi:HDOD domain-containing protein [Candidatus Nitrospira salsa]
MDQHLLQRIKNCKTLPAIPSLPLQVLQMCRDEGADCQRMADIINKDPSFVAKLLNVANSSFYGGARHKVTTVTQAVTLLGMNSIATLAFCFSLYRDLKKNGGATFDHTRHWHRSILSSVAARILGKWAQVENYEEIFLAALLQDLGMLVLSEVYVGDYGQIYNLAGTNHDELQKLERERFGSDHSEVGGWLADMWELPDVMKASVRGSHDPELVDVAEDFRMTVRCVMLSGRLADLWCDPSKSNAPQELLSLMQQSFKMEPQDFITILTEIAEVIPEFSSFFQINLGSDEDIQRVVVNAEQALLTPSPS